MRQIRNSTHTSHYTRARSHVQAHASAAIVNFSEGAEAEFMPPYLDTLITKLLLLLQHGKKLVQVCVDGCVRRCFLSLCV
jgi:hypothetical protein